MGRFLLSSTIEPAIAVAMCVAAISMYTTASRCVDGQREVLLKFKHNILDEYDELRSWGNHTDCCFHWAGVGCDNATGHVIHIGFSGKFYLSSKVIYTSLPFIDELRYLKHLDLGFIAGLLANQSISSLIGNLKNNNGNMISLQHLSLPATGIVGTIPEDLGNNMPALTFLDLSYNELEGFFPRNSFGNNSFVSLSFLDLKGNWLEGPIPENFGNNMSALTHLDLSENRLQGHIPENFGNNSFVSLSFLDLKWNWLEGPIPENFGNNMPSLTHLDLSENGLQGHIPENFGNSMPALAYLAINGNLLGGQIPTSFGENMTGLTQLHLGSNSLEGFIPKTFGKMVKLTYLDLESNLLEGCIPGTLGNMTVLEELHLDGNRLEGEIPKTFGKMVKLTYLGLESNLLEGHIPEALGNMSALEELDLAMNRFEGEIPKSIWNICTLQLVSMESNCLSGSLIISTLCPNHSLHSLHLDSNRITGLFPDLTKFPSLAELSIAFNLLDGVIYEHHFLNLSKLYLLDLSYNSLFFNVTSSWLPPFQLQTIHLRSCKLGPQFPHWLRTQVNYKWLDISNNAISDSIPSWFWSTTSHFSSINASHNEIKGKVVNDAQLSCGFQISGGILDMSFNKLEGVIPPYFFNVEELYLSQNKFTNLNPLCDIKGTAAAGLLLLDISFNQLSGTLPDCWSSYNSLRFLNLANNHNLSGSLPNSIGSLAYLMALHLDRNNFTGHLPSSIKNCSSLVVLHLGDNNLFGPIPDWVGENLKQLAILVLRSNHFNASVPTSLCRLQSLQLLDLSMNRISGTLPKCLSNLSEMTVHEPYPSATISYEIPANLTPSHIEMSTNSSVDDKIDFLWKGRVFIFGSTLRLVKSIDLSSNMLNGEVPTEITSLDGLVSLNLSRNNLRGQIPPKIGNLRKLDTLDLSINHFSGSIPQSLVLIDDISVFNVSNNKLLGKIPKSTQLQSFDASAYMGNPGLCGDPLPNSCAGDEPTHPSLPEINEEGASNREDMDKLIGGEFYASMGVGYAVGFLGVVGTMLFNRSCRFAYFKVLQDVANWAFVVAAIHKRKFMLILGG